MFDELFSLWLPFSPTCSTVMQSTVKCGNAHRWFLYCEICSGRQAIVEGGYIKQSCFGAFQSLDCSRTLFPYYSGHWSSLAWANMYLDGLCRQSQWAWFNSSCKRKETLGRYLAGLCHHKIYPSRCRLLTACEKRPVNTEFHRRSKVLAVSHGIIQKGEKVQ